MAVPRIRIQTKAGISTKGRILKNKKIEDESKQIAEFIGIRGPCSHSNERGCKWDCKARGS